MTSSSDHNENEASRLSRMFRPRSIALVGASPRNAWSRTIISNLEKGGFTGTIIPYGRSQGDVAGYPITTDITEVTEPPDVALLLVRAGAVFDAVKECHEVGMTNFVVFAAGFAEADEDGRQMENQLVTYAREHGLSILGPNMMGFANVQLETFAFGSPIDPFPTQGGTSFVLQSGALAFNLFHYVSTRSLGIDQVITVGNEAAIDASACIEYLVDSPSTKSICLYLQAIRQPKRFMEACRRACLAGKPVIVLKVGSGSQSAQAALAHTAAIVGDDETVDGVLRQSGAIRVRSVEDMVACALVHDHLGELTSLQPAVITGAGSAAELFAERADRLGWALPEFGPETRTRLYEAGLPHYAAARNPLDVTAGVTVDRASALPELYRILLEDPAVDMLVVLGIGLASTRPGPEERLAVARDLQRLQAESGKPVVAMSPVTENTAPDTVDILESLNIPPVIESIDRGVAAMQAMRKWSKRRHAVGPRASWHPDPGELGDGSVPWSEHDARVWLRSVDVPVNPWVLVQPGGSVAEALRTLSGPYCIKICSPDIAHKSDVGGVDLGVSADRLQDCTQDLSARVARARPEARITGVLVTEMRLPAPEMIVGVRSDPQWGLLLTLGTGGLFVEALRDSATRVLPLDKAEILEMLEELRLFPVLHGPKARQPADLDVLCSVISRICAATRSLGGRLNVLELNPLRIEGANVEALDAHVIAPRRNPGRFLR